MAKSINTKPARLMFMKTMKTTAEAELARQFAATQQQRYSGEQPAGANPFSLSDFEFSPMKDLVDDGPSEPLFTRRDA
jgi:hypothetical protein